MDSDSITKQNQAIAKRELVSQLQDMPIVEVACRRAGIARATYYRWLQRDSEFAEQCRAALEHSTQAVSDVAEAKLISAIQEGNMSAISFWLRHHHKAYRAKLDIQGTIRHQATVLTDEQSRLLERALRLGGLINTEGGDDESH